MKNCWTIQFQRANFIAVENTENELNKAFDNYHNSLIKDILKMKVEISESSIEW